MQEQEQSNQQNHNKAGIMIAPPRQKIIENCEQIVSGGNVHNTQSPAQQSSKFGIGIRDGHGAGRSTSRRHSSRKVAVLAHQQLASRGMVDNVLRVKMGAALGKKS